MSEEYTPSVSDEVAAGPTLEEQAREMGISMDDHSTVAGDPAPTQEDLILGKFKNTEDLASAYESLQQKMGQQGSDLSQPMTQAAQYYEQNGNLDEEHYQALDRAGLNRQFVDAYIAGQQAQTNVAANDDVNKYYNQVGGHDNYQNMSGWMQDYLPVTEIEAYNRVMQNGSDDEVGILMTGMYARYEGAMGHDYSQLHGQTVSEGVPGYESRGQVMQALNDPRYETDAQYRAEFESKLAMTSEDVF
jgi:hypothetical protein